jgi:esterase/lipase superfamily enzyme
MQREYHSWFSPILRRQMELLVFGHSGSPLIVFPTSMGRFYDYENRGMISAVESRFASGELHAFCVDSVDKESWYDKDIPPAARVERQQEYDAYLREEVLPFIAERNPAQRVTVTGCSFGGYHSANFAFHHPELVDAIISFGGAFDIRRFLDGYYDDNCYFNNPPDFLPNIGDDTLLNEIRRLRIVLAAGENDLCLDENRRLSRILDQKGIPHCLDIWGDGAGHDWCWWEQMAVKFLGM